MSADSAPDVPLTDAASHPAIARHDRYMTINYGRTPLVMERGRGAELWDTRGRRYVDLFAGFGAAILGHCHPALVEALGSQAKKLWHVGNLLHTQPQTWAAERVAEATGWSSGARCFFCHSGADANEAAIKLARLYGKANPGEAKSEFGRYRIVSTTGGFHGRSFGTMGATGNPAVREGFAPLLPGYVSVPFDDLEAIRSELTAETAAVLIESVQGEGGVNVPSADYFPKLRALCDERDVLLICDEVWTGCGRTGRWFAHQWDGIEPDVMTLGKGVGGGLAVGACVVRDPLARLFDHREMGGVKHATTLGGNCVSMAVTAAIFETIERDGLLEHVNRMSERARSRLRTMAERTGRLTDIRGRGLFLGMTLADGADARTIAARALEEGVLVNATQREVIRLAPPLMIEPEALDEGLDRFERAIR